MDEWKTLGKVDQFKNQGSTPTEDETSIMEVKISLGQGNSAMTKLSILWGKNFIRIPKKIKLHKSLVFSILLYRNENWTLPADPERRIQALENKCYRKMLGIPYRDHKTSEYV